MGWSKTQETGVKSGREYVMDVKAVDDGDPHSWAAWVSFTQVVFAFVCVVCGSNPCKLDVCG